MSVNFEYISSLADDFFGQKKTSKAISVIEINEMTGWEGWFQVEFACFLSEHYSEPEWYREFPVALDRRREKVKTFCKPDFIIRKKGWRKDTYVTLEVKQHPEAKACLSNMMKDRRKIEKIKASEIDIRDFLFLGIHRNRSSSELKDLIYSQFDNEGLDPPPVFATKVIPKTNYAYTIF